MKHSQTAIFATPLIRRTVFGEPEFQTPHEFPAEEAQLISIYSALLDILRIERMAFGDKSHDFIKSIQARRGLQ